MMMHRFTHSALRLLTVLVVAAAFVMPIGGGHASVKNEDGTIAESPSGTTGTPSSSCGWEQFMGAVAKRESTNNPQARNDIGYAGYFQFGEGRLQEIGWYCSQPVKSGAYQSFSGQWCQKAKNHGVNSIQDFLKNPEAQKAAFKEHMIKLYNQTKWCHQNIGKQAPGKSCNITLSGILGGGHLGGAGSEKRNNGVCGYTNKTGAGASDKYGTSIGAYVCCFKGYSICSVVAPGDSSCNDSGGTDGKCGDDTQKNCEGGQGMSDTGAGRYNTDYDNYPDVSGGDLPGGPTEHHLSELTTGLRQIWVASLQIMTSQLMTAMMDQVKAIGTFLDAKNQLELQRLLQQKTAEAHKDYQPSVQMCEIGTMVRNLSNTEKAMEMSHLAIARRILKRELSSGESTTLESDKSDLKSRAKQLRDVFCNVEDNGTEADYFCKQKDSKPVRANRDVDYTTTLDNPLSLEIDIDDGKVTEDEENLFALVNNLFMHRPFPAVAESYTTLKVFSEPFQKLRSVVAMRGVARNSIAAIIAQKTQGPDHTGNSAPYMRALIKEMGLEEEEILKLLGDRPSYYAQMEILTKKIYQDPNFIVNLYDKPANVARIRTSMAAIKSMQDRDIHEAMMRREMLLSMILEIRIRQHQSTVLNEIRNNLYRSSTGPTKGK